MKILTRDDTEHDVEYVTRQEAEREIEGWRKWATDATVILWCLALYQKHGKDWRQKGAQELRELLSVANDAGQATRAADPGQNP